MTDPSLITKWNDRHREASGPPVAARVLEENRHLLPAAGTALDLACGRGGNALLLARHGLAVSAWDISDVAIAKLAEAAQGEGLALAASVRDVTAAPPAPASFDVIVVSHFLERDLCPALAAALRPGGLLFYQTFSRSAVSDAGPGNPLYRLADNELLVLFPGLRVVAYREEGRLGDTAQGFRNEAMLVASK